MLEVLERADECAQETMTITRSTHIVETEQTVASGECIVFLCIYFFTFFFCSLSRSKSIIFHYHIIMYTKKNENKIFRAVVFFLFSSSMQTELDVGK